VPVVLMVAVEQFGHHEQTMFPARSNRIARTLWVPLSIARMVFSDMFMSILMRAA
jgi:hypothetical protein